MSKVDAQRAMREARYAKLRASGPTRREAAVQGGPDAGAAATTATDAPTTAGSAKPARTPKAARAAKPAGAAPTDAAAPATGELCGHRSMNGRSCTREAGHAEKNHRYG